MTRARLPRWARWHRHVGIRWSLVAIGLLGVLAGFLGGTVGLAGVWPWRLAVGRTLGAGVGLLVIGAAACGIVRVGRSGEGRSRPVALWLLATVAVLGIDVFQSSFTEWFLLTSRVGRGLIGAAGLGVVFVALLEGLRAGLRFGSGMLGVARTVVDEAIRMKVGMIFIALLLLAVPVLPFVLNPEEPLRYRIQTFLNYSLVTTGVLLSLMTIFLACATLSREISGKQIFTTAVKPISRPRYLLGKWVGITLLNLVLVVVSGAAIYGLTVFYLGNLPANSEVDRRKVETEVLTARAMRKPMPPVPLEKQAAKRVEKQAQENPQQIREYGKEEAKARGIENPDDATLMELGKQAARSFFRTKVENEWRSIGPNQQSTFVFEDLGGAARTAESIQLRYTISSTLGAHAAKEVPFTARINGRDVSFRSAVDESQVVSFPVDRVVNEKGRFRFTLINNHLDESVRFRKGDLKAFYRVGSFTANFVRAELIIWLKLAFLAMLGLTAATFLSFPVAALLSVLVYLAAMVSPFLMEALQFFIGREEPEAVVAMKTAIRWMGYGVATLFQAFATYSPASKLVSGRLVSWWDVLGCVAWIGVAWTGLVAAVGLVIFRSRELARVQV